MARAAATRLPARRGRRTCPRRRNRCGCGCRWRSAAALAISTCRTCWRSRARSTKRRCRRRCATWSRGTGAAHDVRRARRRLVPACAPRADPSLPVHRHAAGATDADIARTITAEIAQPFDLAHGPLLLAGPAGRRDDARIAVRAAACPRRAHDGELFFTIPAAARARAEALAPAGRHAVHRWMLAAVPAGDYAGCGRPASARPRRTRASGQRAHRRLREPARVAHCAARLRTFAALVERERDNRRRRAAASGGVVRPGGSSRSASRDAARSPLFQVNFVLRDTGSGCLAPLSRRDAGRDAGDDGARAGRRRARCRAQLFQVNFVLQDTKGAVPGAAEPVTPAGMPAMTVRDDLYRYAQFDLTLFADDGRRRIAAQHLMFAEPSDGVRAAGVRAVRAAPIRARATRPRALRGWTQSRRSGSRAPDSRRGDRRARAAASAARRSATATRRSTTTR